MCYNLWVTGRSKDRTKYNHHSIFALLGTFAKLWKVTVNLFMSLHPHATTRLPLGWFSWYLIFEYFSKIYWENSSFIKIGQEKRVLCTFSIIFCVFLLRKKKCFTQKFRETQYTLLCSTTFFLKSVLFMRCDPRELCGFLGHKVCQKPTHTNLYLHQNSHHHPANKQSVLASIVHRAKAVCDQDSLTQELEFLTTVFKENGYSSQQIWRVLKTVTWAADQWKTHLDCIYTLHPDNKWATQQNAG